jgi:hypothetical protein
MKISNFFLDFCFVFIYKFMLSECSLAISCYFYTPKYPQKSATATPLKALMFWFCTISKLSFLKNDNILK